MDLPRIDETRETVAERAAVIEADVPVKLDRLRDGEQVLEVGDIERFGDFHHYQGDYPGYKGTCGICSCETVLRMFGRAVTESQLVQHAIEHRLCKRGRTPGEAGGTRSSDRVRILGDFGIDAHAEKAGSLEDIAEKVEHGHGVILEVNANTLWDIPGRPQDYRSINHAVAVIGYRRNAATGELLGVYINDSGRPDGARRFVSAATLNDCWLSYGGTYDVTDSPYTARH